MPRICLEYGMMRSSNIIAKIRTTLVIIIVTRSADPFSDVFLREFMLVIIEIKCSGQKTWGVFFFFEKSASQYPLRELYFEMYLYCWGESFFSYTCHTCWYLEGTREKLCFDNIHLRRTNIDPLKRISCS